MAQKGLQEEKRTEKMNIVSRALASIYTGVFSINLANENVELQRARDAVYSTLKAGSYLCTYAEEGIRPIGKSFRADKTC